MATTEISPINRFHGEFGYLSNFAPAPVHLYQERYPTVEHAFQAAKAADPEWRDRIRAAATPAKAKALGRQCPLRPDWEEAKLPMMRYLLGQKFAPGTAFRRALDNTKGRELVEGNTWGDRFWGAEYVTEGPPADWGWVGENWLGKLLMEIRDGR